MNIIVTNTTPDLAGNVSIKKKLKKTRDWAGSSYSV